MSGLSWIAELLRRHAPPAGAGAAPVPPVPRPLHADWAWRPDPWAHAKTPATGARTVAGLRLSPEVAVYHDCPGEGVTLAQDGSAGPPFALVMAPGDFAGSFLSLAIDLPRAALAGLGPAHILALHARCAGGLPPGTVARLNLRQGARDHRLSRGLPQGQPFEFDLAALPLGDGPVAAGWVDLIFAAPLPAQVRIDDLTLTRRRRAEP